ncbi:amidase family protein [Marinobacter sp. AN1]|uniref:amidase family protein n=1 Tax=Marinobacter sp. AN1 TaxID=2886046 RepID=UPI00222ECD0B|nr:amidase family protein [Marinobacter sp. AN1]UZD64547.1 amidase family protein [Marinobacter sp. AN1]
MDQPLHYLTASGLMQLLEAGDLTSEALTRSLLQRIERHNPALNAVIDLDQERALGLAREADRKRQAGEPCGPLHGLPMTVKDTWEVPGLGCCAGAPVLSGYRPEQPADVIRRLQDAGAIIIGKTNVPYYASDIQTYNRVYGTSYNPWNRDHTPGGSSGGSAAALASGMTPLEVGSDLAGSIRTPAHFCGVFGHKPSRTLISFRGHIPGPPGTISQPDLAEGGPMARSAEDLETLLKVIAGPRPNLARSWQLSMEPAAVESLAEARIGLWLDDPECPVDHELTNSYRKLADTLAAGGALVTDLAHPLLSLAHIMPAYFNLLGSLLGSGMTSRQKRRLKLFALAEKPLRRITPMTCGMAEFARGTSQTIGHWMHWNETREKMREQVEDIFREVDVMLTPVNPVTAIHHDQSDPPYRRQIRVNGDNRPYYDQFCWIALATLLGLPATSVPIGVTNAGLPYSIQVIGAPGRDLTTLGFARLLEAEGLAGFRKPPGYSGE